MWATAAFAKGYRCLARLGRTPLFACFFLHELTLVIKGMRMRAEFLSFTATLHVFERKIPCTVTQALERRIVPWLCRFSRPLG